MLNSLSAVFDNLKKMFSKQSRSTLGLFKLITYESIDTDILKEVYNMYEMALNCQEEELFLELNYTRDIENQSLHLIHYTFFIYYNICDKCLQN